MISSRRRCRVTLLLGAALLASCNQIPEQRSLKDQVSTFRPSVNAPDSRLQLAVIDSTQGPTGPESTFSSAAGDQSVFREAEIPAERLARTTALLSSLNARQEADQSIVISLPADVLFDFDKANLRLDARAALADTAELLTGYPNAPIQVNGHTDAKGTDAYNDPLSLRRAQAVAAWLKDQAGRTAQTAGFGKRRPVAPNAHSDGSDDPDGRQRNRRVEIVIKPTAPKTG